MWHRNNTIHGTITYWYWASGKLGHMYITPTVSKVRTDPGKVGKHS